jgi:hypothetical protein
LKTHNDFFINAMRDAGLRTDAVGFASIQLDGGIEAVTAKVRAYFEERAGAAAAAAAAGGGGGAAAAAAAGLARSTLAPEARTAAARAKAAALGRASLPVAAFVLGACLGAALQVFIGFHSTCVPLALVAWLMVELALPVPGAAAAAAPGLLGAP